MDGPFRGFREPLRDRRCEHGLFHRVFLRLVPRSRCPRGDRHLDRRDGGVDVVTSDRYAGSANLVATFGDGQRMDVSFTDIANVETGASREDIVFSDLADVGLYEGGRFFGHSGHDDFNQAPIYLDGRFYGPDLAEAAGVFGYNELVGAFGAKQER